jgi:hypothetical protein
MLAGVFCVIGAVAGADGSAATWTLVALAACSSALMLGAPYIAQSNVQLPIVSQYRASARGAGSR